METISKKFRELNTSTVLNLLKAYKHYNSSYEKNIEQFSNCAKTREFVKKIRLYSLQRVVELFNHFEKKFTSRGGIIHYARDKHEVLEIIDSLLKQNVTVVKSKTMLSEELYLNEELQNMKNFEIWETDLGEFIVQQMQQKPSHITAPAIHLSREEIFNFFNKRFGVEEELDKVVDFVRRFLRKKIISAKAGITGANFLVAEVGAIAITENEGNAGMSMSWPEIHIVLATPEKIIPSLRFLGLLWPFLATHATGQKITAYNHLIFGPSLNEEIDGPKEIHLIVFDNGRSQFFSDKNFVDVFACIRCGACLTVCPVFQRVGGHAYQSVYAGPIGSILTPLLTGRKEMYELSFACSQCGLCTERCPASIKIDHLLLLLRNRMVKEKPRFIWKAGFRIYAKTNIFHYIPGKIKNWFVDRLLHSTWMSGRAPLRFSKKTFTRKSSKRNDSK